MHLLAKLGLLLLTASTSAAAPAIGDSVAVAAVDSLPLVVPTFRPDYSQQRIFDERPDGFVDILRRIIDVEWNQHGEPGGAGYLHLTPLSNSGGEIWIDGLPSRNPADLEPATWDLSAIDLANVRRDGGHERAVANFDLSGTRESATAGRTRLRSQFSRSPYETYVRGVSLTTPGAQRELRAEFSEWKSEEGFDFAAPSLGSSPNFGRAKQRRFHTEGRAHTGVGWAVVGFGRGRRDSPGELLGTTSDPRSIERWTGQVYAGLDRPASNALTRLRFFGLDWHEVDAPHLDAQSDGARTGFSAERLAVGRGMSWSASAERWSGVWNFPNLPIHRARGRWVTQLGLAQRVESDRGLSARVGVDGMFAEQSDAADLGAAALVGWQVAGSKLEVGVCRALRAPSLLETDGRRRLDLADGTRRDLVGGGKLPIERLDRAHVAISWGSERLWTRVRAEGWRLSRGIGQMPMGLDQIEFVGGVDLRAEQCIAEVEWRARGGRFDFVTHMAGRALLREPELQAGRGAGWPRGSVLARLRVQTELRSPRNVLLFEIGYNGVGTQYDERTAALGAPILLPSYDWLDLRGGLSIRGAELFCALDNVLDVTASETLGTAQRPQQVRLGLNWTFWN